MSLVLAFARAQSTRFALLVLIRRGYAYAWARNMALYVRWVASELNSSEFDSRWFDDDGPVMVHPLL